MHYSGLAINYFFYATLYVDNVVLNLGNNWEFISPQMYGRLAF